LAFNLIYKQEDFKVSLPKSENNSDPIEISPLLELLSEQDQQLVLSLIKIKQFHLVTHLLKNPKSSIFTNLAEIDRFYQKSGGIEGYHGLVMQLLKKDTNACQFIHQPVYTTITEKNPAVESAIDCGLEHLKDFCEIYVVGGAADRMGFFHEKTHEPMPAAAFLFMGKPLLEHLIDDLKAREYLYFQKFNEKIITPICLLTSDEKNNYQRIVSLLEENDYFGRPKESFIFIRQPMVPSVDLEGMWAISSDGNLVLKPSGHGALWNACCEQKIFSKLFEQNKKYGLIRQINNPIAGIDYNLLAFAGMCLLKQKKFGFFVTRRKKGNPEGAIVFKIKEKGQENFKIATNVEYCSLENETLSEDFPANTNLLFVDLKAAEKAAIQQPFCGAILNFKSLDPKASARLELSMQNLSDSFLDEVLDFQHEHKDVLLVMQERNKAISTIKKLRLDFIEQHETPLRAFYDLFLAHEALFKENCSFKLPIWDKKFETLMNRPPYLVFFNALLGPMFSDIAKKINRWHLENHAYIDLQLAKAKIQKIKIDGALNIQDLSEDQSGYCHMENVYISNQGFDYDFFDPFFNKKRLFKESLDITLKKNSCLFIVDSEFVGSHKIEVEEGQTVLVQNNKILYLERKAVEELDLLRDKIV
jgi:UDP-N-acetylglucosamine pyrophosphorylase